MRELVIYECGAMSGLTFAQMNTWREYFKIAITNVAESIGKKIRVVNPVDYYNFREPKHKTQLEIMQFDLLKVRESNIIVVNLEKLSTSIASSIECYEAYKLGIPVLAFGSDEDYEKLHPWVQCCITRHDKDYRECINYIRDFYMT